MVHILNHSLVTVLNHAFLLWCKNTIKSGPSRRFNLTSRVFQFPVGYWKKCRKRVRFGSGKSVEIQNRVFSGIYFTLGYIRVFLGISGYIGYHLCCGGSEPNINNINNIIRFYCVTRAPLLYFLRSWVALSLLCESVSEWGIGNTCPNLHFLQYIKARMSSTDPVSSITNCHRLIVSYTDPVHSFIIS